MLPPQFAGLQQGVCKDRIRSIRMEHRWEASMQRLYLLNLPILLSVVLLSSATLAQQPTPAAPDAIGHPPPLPGPPPASGPPPTPALSVGEPSAAKPASPAPAASEAAPKGYMGAYAPPGTQPIPYSTGPLPTQDTGPGLDVAGPDGVSTKQVRAVPCSTVAHETDGFTTCVGIPEPGPNSKRR
jgi:hypothetical protein